MPQADNTLAAPEVREFPRQLRAAVIEPASFNEADRTVDVVFTRGARVKRYDWMQGRRYEEELVVTPEAVDMSRFDAGAVSVLDTHSSYELNNVIGIAVSGAIVNGEGRATLRLSQRDDCAGIVKDIQAGVIRNISVGYSISAVEIIEPEARTDGGALPLYRATRWQPMELSFVPISADADAGTRSLPAADSTAAPQSQGYPCTIQRAAPAAQLQEQSMPDPVAPAAAGSAAAVVTVDENAVRTAATQAERARVREITDLCTRAGHAALADGFINDGKTVDAVRAAVLDKMFDADQTRGNGGPNVTRIQTIQDEGTTRRQGMEDAIFHRLSPNGKVTLTDNARRFRAQSLVEMIRSSLVSQNVPGAEYMAPMEVAARTGAGYMTTGDFTSILANVANKRLRMAYEQSPSSFRLWSKRGPNARDFKNISVTSLSSAPALLQVNEHGEFKTGTMVDGAETYNVVTAGRIVGLTRQAIVNDDLSAFDRIISGFGASAERYQNAVVVSILTTNAVMSDAVALFSGVSGLRLQSNVQTGATSALDATNALGALKAMRAQMRLQQDTSGVVLNLTPSFLLVPAALEQPAYQFTSANYVPATAATINEFRQGGKTQLTPIIEPLLDADSLVKFYGLADPSQIDTIEYCYLDGFEGPAVEQENGFDTDGIRLKCRLDFGAKAIDWRGMHRSAGA